ncbi:hypothetical protein Tco_0699132 [Tanacetum coccineum]
MAKDLSDIRGELNVLTTAFKELYVAGASKNMFFEETSEAYSMQTPSVVQNQQVSQSSQGQATRQQSVLRQQKQQGQATRQPTQLNSMGAAGECYKHATKPTNWTTIRLLEYAPRYASARLMIYVKG